MSVQRIRVAALGANTGER